MKINPASNENTIISYVNAPSPVVGSFSVWANDRMLVWSATAGMYSFDPNVKGIGPVEMLSKTIYMYKKD